MTPGLSHDLFRDSVFNERRWALSLEGPNGYFDSQRNRAWSKARIGTAQVTVFTSAPGGGTSSAIGDVIVSPNGNVVYDRTNGVSWLANFDLPASNRFGLPVCDGTVNTKTCVNASGSMSYQAAAAWVAAMNAADFLGHSNWQIPTTPIRDTTCGFIGPQNNSFGWGCSASAFGSLYGALGLSAPATAVPVPNMPVGPFSNFQPALCWSGTSLPQPTGDVGCCGTFSFNSGWQGSNITSNFLFLIPMIPGKIPGTPTPSGTGLQVNSGGQTVYDPIANVTWLADANLPASNTLGMPRCTTPSPQKCVSQDGALNFNSAAQFITNMNAAAYLGQSNWQMPPVDPNCAAGYLCSVANAPFQSLFYTQLGLTPGKPVVTAPNIAVGAFTNIRPYLYWTCQGNTIHDPCDGSPASGSNGASGLTMASRGPTCWPTTCMSPRTLSVRLPASREQRKPQRNGCGRVAPELNDGIACRSRSNRCRLTL